MDRKIEKKKWTARKIALLASITFLLLLLLYLLFFRDKSSKLHAQRNQLTIAEVSMGKFQEFIPIDGIVLPKTTIYIDAVMGGSVQKIYVEDGAMLNTGDTILKLINTQLELSYMEQETRIFEAINNLQNTKISLEQSKYTRQREIVAVQQQLETIKAEYNRLKKLFTDSLIAAREFEDTERSYRYTIQQLEINRQLQRLDSLSAIRRNKQIDVSMDRLFNNLDLLRTSLGNLYITAPASGQLSSFNIEVGQTAATGVHIGHIDVPGEFKLRANIDERYISRVSTGQEASYEFNGVTYNLSIQKIFTEVTSGSFQVDLVFIDEYPAHVKRGQTLQLRLHFSGETDAIIVRRGSFFQQTGGNWIYVLDPSGEFATRRNIRINRQNTSFYEITEGLQPGEMVIVSSYESFGNKDKIILK